jgi:hypothetical protein
VKTVTKTKKYYERIRVKKREEVFKIEEQGRNTEQETTSAFNPP